MTESKNPKEMTEKEKMLAMKRYNPGDEELTELRNRCWMDFLPALNSIYGDTTKTYKERFEGANNLCRKYFSSFGEGSTLIPPFHTDYACFINVGKNTFINAELSALDSGGINIGDDCFIGPRCAMYTATHPTRLVERTFSYKPKYLSLSSSTPNPSLSFSSSTLSSSISNYSSTYAYNYSLPINIHNNVWIGGNVTICPGVVIMNGSIIGAGSVVNSNIPENCIAVGNPARVVRKIKQDERLDEMELRKLMMVANNIDLSIPKRVSAQLTLEHQEQFYNNIPEKKDEE